MHSLGSTKIPGALESPWQSTGRRGIFAVVDLGRGRPVEKVVEWWHYVSFMFHYAIHAAALAVESTALGKESRLRSHGHPVAIEVYDKQARRSAAVNPPMATPMTRPCHVPRAAVVDSLLDATRTLHVPISCPSRVQHAACSSEFWVPFWFQPNGEWPTGGPGPSTASSECLGSMVVAAHGERTVRHFPMCIADNCRVTELQTLQVYCSRGL